MNNFRYATVFTVEKCNAFILLKSDGLPFSINAPAGTVTVYGLPDGAPVSVTGTVTFFSLLRLTLTKMLIMEVVT